MNKTYLNQDTNIDSGKSIKWDLESENGVQFLVLQFTNDDILDNVESGNTNSEMPQTSEHIPNSAMGGNLFTWVIIC